MRIFACLLVCLFVLNNTYVSANTYQHDDPTIAELIDKSDIVFQGSVIKVDYQDSAVSAGAPATPHTFVTYSISEILSGDYSGDTITLRFVGGPRSNQPDVMLLPSEFPIFNEGDEDVLFVVDNTVRACPLVGCSSGRLRVVNETLHDDEGAELGISSQSKLNKTGRISSDNVFIERTIGINKIRIISSPDSTTSNHRSANQRAAKSSDNQRAAKSSDFSKIAKELRNTLGQNRRKTPAIILNAQVGVPFQFLIGKSTSPSPSTTERSQ